MFSEPYFSALFSEKVDHHFVSCFEMVAHISQIKLWKWGSADRKIIYTLFLHDLCFQTHVLVYCLAMMWENVFPVSHVENGCGLNREGHTFTNRHEQPPRLPKQRTEKLVSEHTQWECHIILSSRCHYLFLSEKVWLLIINTSYI